MGRAPIEGARTLSSQISSYLNEKYIDFKIGHIGQEGVRVVLEDIPEKLWNGLIGPEFVRFADKQGLKVSAAHFGSHSDGGISLIVIIMDCDAAQLARRGWLLTRSNVEGIDYYAAP